ncbi:hypothetical protein LQZ18_12545 [Lachnospiraceae bacterium ZAX-1]
MSAEQGFGYIKTDIMRSMRRKNLIPSILGVILVLIFSVENTLYATGSVLYVFTNSTDRIGFMITFVFCSYAYGTSFSEDLESSYIRYALIRGNLKRYVCSKVITILFLSIFVMVVGCLLFAFLCRIWLPWHDPYAKENVIASSMFAVLIEHNMVVPWIFLFGFLRGICAGVLTLISSLASLFITNKMLVLAMPALVYQLTTDLFTGIFSELDFLGFWITFDLQKSIFYNGMHSFLWAVFYALLLSCMMGIAIYKKIGEKI